MTNLPRDIDIVGVPPIKCQGIKTMLVPFIAGSIAWEPSQQSKWIEPFLGSGVVLLNIRPQRALVADSNEHIIRLYRRIFDGELTGHDVRIWLEQEGAKLSQLGAEYFYEVRARFNEFGDTLDFIFLNRSCFNGVMRFNKKGGFNVPFGHKPQRFSKAYISRIANQVDWTRNVMQGRDWTFEHLPYQKVLAMAETGDFIYADPPYIGRHTDYYNNWTDLDAKDLAQIMSETPAGFAVSMWLENVYRKNDHIEESWGFTTVRTCSHFYHVGSTESLRNEMQEALLIKPTHSVDERTYNARRMPAASAAKRLQPALFERGREYAAEVR